jgi:hypothetical protein
MRTPSPVHDALEDDLFTLDGLREASLEDKVKIDHLESKIVILENRQDLLIRALTTVELLPVHPNVRMEAVNNRAAILMQNIEPIITPLFGQNVPTDEVERVTNGIITLWSEATIFRDMLTTVTSLKYPTSRGRPLFSFRNYQKVYNDQTKRPLKALDMLLEKFSMRLPTFRKNISFLNETTTHNNVVMGFLRTAAVCLLFHNTETNHNLNELYRYGIYSNVFSDYFDDERYQTEVFTPNQADLKQPEIINIADDMVDLRQYNSSFTRQPEQSSRDFTGTQEQSSNSFKQRTPEPSTGSFKRTHEHSSHKNFKKKRYDY